MYLGELAALGTALCWSCGSIFFTISARLIGSTVVNRLRLLLAFFLLATTQLVLTGRIMPDLSASGWFWFGISGIVGFAIGDGFLFRAFVLLGPRITMLVMSLVPIFSALLGWIFVHEVLTIAKIMAILATLLGVTWVVISRKTEEKHKGSFMEGMLMALGGALCQALGLFLSKKGLMTGISVLSGNAVRILIAVAAVWLFTVLKGNPIESFKRLKNRQALIGVCFGAMLGPFLGVSLSLVAIQHTYMGIASTIMALPPVFLIPLSYWVFKEKITIHAVLGTVVALVGVALLFMI